DGGARVTDTERVVLAFRARRKWCKAVLLLDGVQLVAASCEHFVRIGLVPYVPHKPVIRRVEDVVQRYRQFDSAETRGEMPATGAYGLNQKLAQFLGEARKLGGR